MRMPSQRGRFGLSLAATGLLVASLFTYADTALAATPVSGDLGPANGAQIAWDFAAVGPGVSSGGTVEFVCAPVYCDPFTLNLTLPAPDATFYVDHKATLTITYTWTSTQPDVIGRENAAEPSVGTDWKTGAAMYMAGTQVSKITFDAAGHATWKDVTPLKETVVNEDAILFTDHARAAAATTNRTFITGLLVATSNADYSDNDGTAWVPATVPVPHSPDHESVGAGPYALPKPASAAN